MDRHHFVTGAFHQILLFVQSHAPYQHVNYLQPTDLFCDKDLALWHVSLHYIIAGLKYLLNL